jgi:hypothetical protein
MRAALATWLLAAAGACAAADRLCPLALPEAAQMPGETEHWQADLDGDGRPEQVSVRLDGISNGLGVHYHAFCVLTAERHGSKPVCRAVDEWRKLSLLVQEDGRRGCSLWSADWQPGRERGRGDGTYAVGRLLRWQHGRWVPAADRPAIRRRLLNSFDAEINGPAPNAQGLWYQHPLATPVRAASR